MIPPGSIKPFNPPFLPIQIQKWDRLIPLLGQSHAQLARYDGILKAVPNPAVLLSPLTSREAVLSSKIEGTQATLQEVLEFDATAIADPRKENDIREIVNYRKAIAYAVKELRHRPLSLNLVKRIHYILMESVRGKDKMRGEFRNCQAWIGKYKDPIEKASYIPPSPDQILPLMSNLEKYIHETEKDPLVQLAVVHAQFELIHPFMDGNGRVGRILIPLFLCEKNLLESPMFYLSQFLEEHRDFYIDNLNLISHKNDWESWLVFFLTAIREQAKTNIQKTNQILSLYQRIKMDASKIIHSTYTMQAIDTIFSLPILSSSDFVRRSAIPMRTALRILESLKEGKILLTLVPQKGRQPEVFIFNALLKIVH